MKRYSSVCIGMGTILSLTATAPSARADALDALKASVQRAETAEERGDARKLRRARDEVFQRLTAAMAEQLRKDGDGVRFVLDLYGSILDHRINSDDAEPFRGFRSSYDDLTVMLTTPTQGKTRRRVMRRVNQTLEAFFDATEAAPREQVAKAYRDLDRRVSQRLKRTGPARQAAARMPLLSWSFRVYDERGSTSQASALQAQAKKLVQAAREDSAAATTDLEVLVEAAQTMRLKLTIGPKDSP